MMKAEDETNEPKPPVNEVVVTRKEEVTDPSDKFTLSEADVTEGATVVSNENDEQSSVNDQSQVTAKSNDTTMIRTRASLLNRFNFTRTPDYVDQKLATLTKEQKKTRKEMASVLCEGERYSRSSDER